MISVRYTCLLLLCLLGRLAVRAQVPDSPRFNIGDPAPALRVSHWLKGSPLHGFKKGESYVVEFWATWCHHWRIHDKTNAITCEQKAIKTLKNGAASRLSLATLEARLQQYQAN